MQNTSPAKISVVGKLTNPSPVSAAQISQQFLGRGMAGHFIKAGLTTEEFAFGIGLKAQSIRKRYSQTGEYFGVRPVKLPSGRLMFPPDALELLKRRGFTARKKNVLAGIDVNSGAEIIYAVLSPLDIAQPNQTMVEQLVNGGTP